MALTPGQKQCVDTLVGPVAVSAGAGSGKTFTLTRRIVHSLECGFVSGIDEVLAITITSKAAGEIKSRVKGALKVGGLTRRFSLTPPGFQPFMAPAPACCVPMRST